MDKRNCAPCRCGIVCTALALLLVNPTAVCGNQSALPHIRSGSADVRALLDLGYARSATFRSMVDRLERSSVIVYVRFARCAGRVPACLHYLGERNSDRYVRITIDRVAGCEAKLCCLLAHELRHAVELADAPQARTHSDVRRLLADIGHQWGEGFETAGAVAAARAVGRELAAGPGGRGGTRS